MIDVLRKFMSELERLVESYATDLAREATGAGLTKDIDIYDKILELEDGKAIEQCLESLGFDLFKLCEETQLLLR